MIQLSKNVDITSVQFVKVKFNGHNRDYTYFAPKNETIKIGDYATVLTPRGTIGLVEVVGFIPLSLMTDEKFKGIIFKPLHQILVPYDIEFKEAK